MFFLLRRSRNRHNFKKTDSDDAEQSVYTCYIFKEKKNEELGVQSCGDEWP